MSLSVRAVQARLASLRVKSWLQNHLEGFAAADQRHRIIKFLERKFSRDKAAFQEHLRQSRCQHAPHRLPGLEQAAADDSLDPQTLKNDVVCEVHFHFAVWNAEKHERASHAKQIE